MYVAIWLFAAPACVYFIVRVLLVAARNHKAHKFFAERAPELPLVPGGRPNIFSGHITRVIVRKDNIQTIARLHEQLGPTFGFYRAEQPWVLTKDLDLLKLIELDEPHKHINRAQYGLPFREFRNCIFEARDDAWRRVRRAIAPALTNRMVRSEDTTGDIQSVLEQLAAGIRARLTSDRSMILNAGDMFQRYTLAVIFLLTYRRERIIDFHAARDDWVARMDWAARRIKNPFAAASVMFPFTRPLIELLVKLHPVGRMNAQITDYVKGAADLNREARERMQKTTPRGQADTTRVAYKRRLIDSIIDALFEKRIQYDEFIGNGQFLLLAGFQTTADTITCLVWQLARHAAIQEQLRASLRNEGLESELLDWCVRETIRFHPAVPLGHGRVLGEDVQVNDGLRLPKGTFVMPSTHAIHHDAKIWPDPEAFKPERWRHAAEFHPAAFMGFGLGPRNCVGAKLAMHEIKLAIKLLLANYRIEKCRDTPDQYDFSAPGMIFTLLNVPIKVRLVELDVKKVNLE